MTPISLQEYMSSIEPCETDYESGCRTVLYVGCGFEFIIIIV